MLEQLRQLAAQAVEMARSAGAGDAFATATRVRTVEFEQRDDLLERVQESTSRSLGLRLWVDGRYSEHSTSVLEPDRLRAFVTGAVSIARAIDVDPERRIPEPSLYEGRPTDDLDLVDPAVNELTPAARVETCQAIVAAAREHERVISATGAVADYHEELAAASSNGFAGEEEGTAVTLSGFVTLRGEGDARPDGSYDVAATHVGDLPEPDAVGAEALRRAVTRLGSVQGPTRRTTMVVEPMMAGSLMRRLLAPATAEAVSQERSIYQDRLGQTIFAERLSVTDDPLLRRGLGSRHFDGEGLSARRLPIIEQGRAAGLYVDTYYGRKIHQPPTTGSISNVVVATGDRELAQLVADAGEGVLVTAWIGGNSDPTRGEFSIGIRGQLIEGGQVGQAVGEMNVSGNLLALFAGLAALGSDPWVYSTWRVPTLVFEGVQFSGA
jgi:PmbA protein